MSGHVLPLAGSDEPWSGGRASESAVCVLAPNPSPWTLDGTNTWILGADGEDVAIVDPGPDVDTHRESIDRAVEDRRVRVIVLTHGHLDHSEGAVALARHYGAPIRAVDPSLRLGDEGLGIGDVIDVAGGCEVVLTPGHTSDSASLLMRADRSLVAGDTILGRGTALVAWPDGDLADYLDSLERLRDLSVDVERLLPGHGPALGQPAEGIDAYLTHRRARLEEIRSLVRQGLTDAGQIVAIAYADVPREIWPAAELTVRAQLAFLDREGG